MSLRRDADVGEIEYQITIRIDPGFLEFDEVGRADAEVGDEAVRTDDLGAAFAVFSGGVGVACAGHGRPEREAALKAVEHYQITLRRPETLVRHAAQHDRADLVHRHIQPRPMRRHVSPRQHQPISVNKIVIRFHRKRT